VVGTGSDDIEQRLKPSLEQWIPEGTYKADNKHNMWIAHDNSVAIYFKSVDQKARKFQGDEIDFIWMDEDPEDRFVWSECLGRTFRRPGNQILVTMTAWQGSAWLHSFMFSPDEYAQENKIITRISVDENPYYFDCDNCEHPKQWHIDVMGRMECLYPKCDCHEFSNKMGARALHDAGNQWRGIEKLIRFHGHFYMLAGKPVIDPDVREKHEKKAIEPLCGYLSEKNQFVNVGDPEDERVWFRICKGPEVGVEYILGGDFGTGNPTGDYHAAVIINTQTGEQVALAHTRNVETRDFAEYMVLAARFYNDAFIVPEANPPGMAGIDKIYELGYGHVYVRKIHENVKQTKGTKKGFWTDKKSKPFAVKLMVDLLTHRWTIYDPLIHAEMYNYTWLKENREGNNGIGNSNPDGHDDCMSALFLAAMGWHTMGLFYQVKGEEPLVPKPPRKDTIEEMLMKDIERKPVEEEDLAGEVDGFQQELWNQLEGEGEFWDGGGPQW
jgi:phage terminase large subunit-like protein